MADALGRSCIALISMRYRANEVIPEQPVMMLQLTFFVVCQYSARDVMCQAFWRISRGIKRTIGHLTLFVIRIDLTECMDHDGGRCVRGRDVGAPLLRRSRRSAHRADLTARRGVARQGIRVHRPPEQTLRPRPSRTFPAPPPTSRDPLTRHFIEPDGTSLSRRMTDCGHWRSSQPSSGIPCWISP